MHEEKQLSSQPDSFSQQKSHGQILHLIAVQVVLKTSQRDNRKDLPMKQPYHVVIC